MIHRFVDLLEEEAEPERSIIWNIRRQTGGTTRTFAVAGGGMSTLADYLDVPAGADLDRPNLSPDLTEYAYTVVGSLGVKGQVRLAASDDLSASILLAENPSGAAANPTGGTDIIGWSPDSQHVYYRGINNNTDRDSEIWRVDRDGTGDTLVWSSTAIDGVMWGLLPRISPDGTMIAFWLDFDANPNDGLYVIDDLGTPVENRIYTQVGSGEFYGWSRDSQWLLFRDDNSGANWQRIFKIRPDGTDQTILSDATSGTNPYRMSFGQNSVWLPDGGSILAKNDTGSGHEVGTLLTDGSETFTAFSPQRFANVGVQNGPVYSYGRAYWLEGDGSVATSKVVSTLVDGSDYRVDDDMTDASTTPQHDDYVFLGFARRTA